MTTVRHVEKLWKSRTWGRLLREMLTNRPESSPRLTEDLDCLVAAASMAMIRLDELNQTHTGLYAKLLRTVLCSQDPDGGWRDPLLTALCLRALLIDSGQGLAIDRGMAYLATMQKSEGIWPKMPFRRLAADPFTSAYVLLQLAGNEQFRRTVRFDDAIDWFLMNEDSLDDETERLWQYVAATLPRRLEPAPLWS